jgi:uncharacterized protein YecT (DUF1311 family)
VRKAALFVLFLMTSLFSIGQGEIDHIKNQSYMKGRHQVNCDSLEGDNLSSRICANLAFQKSDSVLSVVYNQLLSKVTAPTKAKIISLQKTWRKMRNEHCGLIVEGYQGHSLGVIYLNCMKELTDNRIKELNTLNEFLP